MHHYIILGTRTDEGLRDIQGTPKRVEEAHQLLQRLGGRMRYYYTMGEYDFVAIVDIASEDNMIQFLSEVTSFGYVRTTTLKAWSDTEVAQLYAKK
ncbi:MAG: GYD domain-containing protein [Candidatus Methanospirareceae archaeon]